MSIAVGIQPTSATVKAMLAASTNMPCGSSVACDQSIWGIAIAAATSVASVSAGITSFMKRSSQAYPPIESSTAQRSKSAAETVAGPFAAPTEASSVPPRPKSAIATPAVTSVTTAVIVNMVARVRSEKATSTHVPCRR